MQEAVVGRRHGWRLLPCAAVLALALAGLGGCGGHAGSSGPVLGGESHFLESCSTGCGEGLSCIGGVCTRACEMGIDSCTDLASAAVCFAASPATGGVCGVACEQENDCASLGGLTCSAGFCQASGAVPNLDAENPFQPPGGALGTPEPAPAGRSCDVPLDERGLPFVSTPAQIAELEGCEEISGALYIDSPDGVRLDLRPLAALRRVLGPLTIGCNPYLGTDSFCGESEERSLTLDGLQNLESVMSLTLGGLRIPSLSELSGLRNIGRELHIVNCNSLGSLDGLQGLSAVSRVSLKANSRLESLTGLSIAPAAALVHIQNAPSLTDLSVLRPLVSAEHFELREMPLRNLDVLSNLRNASVVYLIDVPELSDVSGLSQLRTLEKLYLQNTGLQNLAGLLLESLAALDLWDNTELVEVDALSGVQLGSLTAIGNASLVRLPAFPNVTVSTGVSLQFNDVLAEGPFFPSIERMDGGPITISGNSNLLRLTGFSALNEAAEIEIRQNANLVEVGFPALKRAARLQITCNPELPDASLAPLSEVSSVYRQLTGNQGSEELCEPL